MSVVFNNTVFGTAQSETGLFALNNFTGTALLSGVAPVTINGTIDQPNSTVTINLNAAGLTAVGATGNYLGFSPADANGNYVYYFQVTGGGLITPVTIGVTTAPTLPALNVLTPVNTTNTTAPACFVTGTHIRTLRGEVLVEELEVGDVAVTASGEHRPIVWIGHADAQLPTDAGRRDAQPIRILAGAIAPGMPVRDLIVSPGHRLFFDDVLIQARFLVNGTTIVREELDRVTYWHVELDRHDVLLAEGVPSESYQDVANRGAFDNGEVVFGERARPAVRLSQLPCAPLADEGPRLHAVRGWLLGRASHLGSRHIADPGMQLLADGLVLTPLSASDGRFVYAVPADAGRLVLRSRSAVPREVVADSDDDRQLGVRVTGLMLDDAEIRMDDERLGDGWHEPEADGTFRWTDGEAELPPARRIAIRAEAAPRYTVCGIRDLAPAHDDALAAPHPLKLVG